MSVNSSVYKKNPDIIFRKIAGECILVPIRRQAEDLENIYTLNEVAAMIWELIDGESSLEKIEDRIAREFEVSEEIARADLTQFIDQLKVIGGITD